MHHSWWFLHSTLLIHVRTAEKLFGELECSSQEHSGTWCFTLFHQLAYIFLGSSYLIIFSTLILLICSFPTHHHFLIFWFVQFICMFCCRSTKIWAEWRGSTLRKPWSMDWSIESSDQPESRLMLLARKQQVQASVKFLYFCCFCCSWRSIKFNETPYLLSLLRISRIDTCNCSQCLHLARNFMQCIQ